MIDASKGFLKDGNKNRLRERDIHKILDAFALQADIEKFSRLVPVEEIKNPSNDYSLNLPRYVDVSEPQDIQDIDGHIRGGIPNSNIEELSKYWDLFESLKPDLISTSNREGYSALSVDAKEISPLINNNKEVIQFKSDVHNRFENWKKIASAKLLELDANTRPKAFISELSESLLNSFKDEPLIDAYGVYQGFMEYWEETLKDDEKIERFRDFVDELVSMRKLIKQGFETAKLVDGVLPMFKGILHTVDARVIWEGKDQERLKLVPVASLLLDLDSGDPDRLTFQITPQKLNDLLTHLNEIKEQMTKLSQILDQENHA